MGQGLWDALVWKDGCLYLRGGFGGVLGDIWGLVDLILF